MVLRRAKNWHGEFSADLTMETSDYGISNATAVDPANPNTRGAHAHQISTTNAAVSYDMSIRPVYSPPTSGAGIVVSSTATATGNGGPASFESKGASTLEVCITGRISGRVFEHEYGVHRTCSRALPSAGNP